tara:strand:+ start:456 stop:860 length:405 start_codon:yes stop_codon:yes gene_type:complete
MYKERTGLRARGRKNSKMLECAGRFFCEQPDDEWFTAKDIYYRMTFKNGNLYKNHRFARSFGTFRHHLNCHEGFERKTATVDSNIYYDTKGWVYTFDKNNYKKYFPNDPHRARGKDRVYQWKGTKAYKDNQKGE